MSRFRRFFGIRERQRIPGQRPDKPTFRENLLALKHLPPFLKLVWGTHKGLTIANILLRIIQAGIPVSTLYVAKLIIDEVVELSQAGGVGDTENLYTFVAIEFGLAIFSAILSRGISLSQALLGDLFNYNISHRLMGHAARLDLAQYEDSTFYDKLDRARRQTRGRTVLISQLLTQVQDMLTIGFLATGLVVFNPWLIILLVIAVIPSFLSETYFNQRGYSLTRSWTPERRELDYLRFIAASDTSVKEVKLFGLASYLQARFLKLANKYYLANRLLAIRRAAWGLLFNSLGDAGYYFAYVLIIGQTIEGTLTIGDLTFLAGSFNRMRNLLRGLLQRLSNIAESALYLQDLFDFFAMEPEIDSLPEPLPFPKKIQEGFTFENVSFLYPNSERYALKNVSFHLKAGEKLALVGENGAGKTTLVKLLARLYDPSEGRILLDGHDLKEYDLVELRAAIGVIFQDFIRFHFTASDNLAIGEIEERENRPQIEMAAHQSLADTVIEKLPKGYDQILGRRFGEGTELSGGEWQKIALGRAYMREDAELLILDEPTAALDARAEYEVFQRFTELTQGKSTVLISHRFSTVRMADRILVLEGGHKKEIGSHEELLELNGLYAELFHLQAEGYK